MIARILDALDLAREVARLQVRLHLVTRERNRLAGEVIQLEGERQLLRTQIAHMRKELEASRERELQRPAHRWGLS